MCSSERLIVGGAISSAHRLHSIRDERRQLQRGGSVEPRHASMMRKPYLAFFKIPRRDIRSDLVVVENIATVLGMASHRSCAGSLVVAFGASFRGHLKVPRPTEQDL